MHVWSYLVLKELYIGAPAMAKKTMGDFNLLNFFHALYNEHFNVRA